MPVQEGMTDRCHLKYKYPSNWHITHSKKHWSTESTMIGYIEEVIIPYVRAFFEEEKPLLWSSWTISRTKLLLVS